MCIDMDLSGYSYLVDLEHPTGGHGRERWEVCKCTNIGKYMCSYTCTYIDILTCWT